MNIKSLIPKDKFDIETAKNLAIILLKKFNR